MFSKQLKDEYEVLWKGILFLQDGLVAMVRKSTASWPNG
jgi:hypothetical protein